VIKIQTVARAYIARVICQRKRHRNERRARQRAEQIQNRRDIERRERDRREDEQTGGKWHSVKGRKNDQPPTPPVQEAPRMRGRIQNWIDHKDYGFVNVDGGGRLFFHRNRISEHGYNPSRDDIVQFDIITNRGRDECGNVSRVSAVRYTGRIQNWVSNKNFGFINVNGGGRIFIHSRHVTEDNYIPSRGDNVEFTIVSSNGRQEANQLVHV